MDVYKNREVVFVLLFACSEYQCDEAIADLMDLIAEECRAPQHMVGEAWRYVQHILPHIPAADEIISSLAQQYTLDRIYSVERVVLRWALFEVQQRILPIEIIIAEAKRLTKKFSTEDGAQFVHALLAKHVATEVS